MTDQPQFGEWISHIDSAGQLAGVKRNDAADGRSAELMMDRLALILPEGDAASGAVVFAGSLPASVPPDLDLAGFLLTVTGQTSRTAGTQAQITASVANVTRSLEWPLLSIAGTPAAPEGDAEDDVDFMPTNEFSLTCLALDFNPAQLGVPPFRPLPPIPITVSMQGRCRLPDEAIDMNVTTVTVTLLTY